MVWALWGIYLDYYIKCLATIFNFLNVIMTNQKKCKKGWNVRQKNLYLPKFTEYNNKNRGFLKQSTRGNCFNNPGWHLISALNIFVNLKLNHFRIP